MLRRAFQMLVISPLIALAMLAKPMLSRAGTIDTGERRRLGGRPSRRPRKASRFYTPNGARECARRRRQIENGQLRVSA